MLMFARPPSPGSAYRQRLNMPLHKLIPDLDKTCFILLFGVQWYDTLLNKLWHVYCQFSCTFPRCYLYISIKKTKKLVLWVFSSTFTVASILYPRKSIPNRFYLIFYARLLQQTYSFPSHENAAIRYIADLPIRMCGLVMGGLLALLIIVC